MKEIELSKKMEKEIDSILEETVDLEEILEDLTIEDQDDFDSVVELISEYKEKKTFLENERLSVVDPLNKVTRKVNSWFKPTIKKLEKCTALLREKIIDYENEKNRKRLEAVKKGKKKPRILRTNQVKYRTTWDYKIDNFDDIPKEYLSLDHSKVRIELREQQGDLEIPGLEIYSKKVPIVS